MNTTTYICPNCGHEFKRGEYSYNYDFDILEFDCPDCGWDGDSSEVDTDDDEEDDDE